MYPVPTLRKLPPQSSSRVLVLVVWNGKKVSLVCYYRLQQSRSLFFFCGRRNRQHWSSNRTDAITNQVKQAESCVSACLSSRLSLYTPLRTASTITYSRFLLVKVNTLSSHGSSVALMMARASLACRVPCLRIDSVTRPGNTVSQHNHNVAVRVI
jgi:hypothetical protein